MHAENDPTGQRPLTFGARRPAPALADADDGDDAAFNTMSDRLNHTLARRVPFRTATVRLDQAIVSFTFDDFPVSASERGAPILEENGVRGTYYAATALTGQRRALWTVAGAGAIAALHAAGHEIGLHSHGHRPATAMPARDYAADLAANRAALRRIVPGLADETYAYPFGISGIAQKRRLGRLVRASRSVQRGLNLGRIDLDFIRAYELTDRSLTPEALAGLLDEAAGKRAWLVFFTHDVAENPSRYGTHPALLAAAVRGALGRGMAVLPVRDALDVIGID